jgi:hypothetical protein
MGWNHLIFPMKFSQKRNPMKANIYGNSVIKETNVANCLLIAIRNSTPTGLLSLHGKILDAA